MNKGFTLIELLVVVLVIAILAAVALPQYSASVERAKMSEAVLNTKAILDAMERVRLETGSYPQKFDVMDISLPNTQPCIVVVGGGPLDCISNDKWDYYLYNGMIQALKTGGADVILEVTQTQKNCLVKKFCSKYSLYTRLCKGLTGKAALYTSTSNYDYYRF
ncbi:hypothetical protein FACS189437_00940 [Bacteroidia bacterium]|nr:hypothetical protein FACS189437_00940 [Bacteroidia bacterium]